MSKKTEAEEWRAKELERRRRMVLSMQRKMDKLAARVKILSERKFKSQRAKNNQLIRIYGLVIRIRIIQGQVLMVISQPLHKFPPGTEIHPNYGKEIAHVNLDGPGEQIISPDGKAFMVPKATIMNLPVHETIQTILDSTKNSERIFPKFDNLGKTDEGVY